MTKIKFNIYAHDSSYGEKPCNYAENVIQLQFKGKEYIPLEELEGFFDTDPLYEVKFDVEYDNVTKEFEIIDFSL